MYSVGETIENGHAMSTAAPDLWIRGNKLLWPPGPGIPNRKNPSLPEPGWVEYEFKILRGSIETFEEALELEQKYSKHRNSDSFKEAQIRKQMKRDHPVTHVKRLQHVYNVKAKIDTNLKAARKAGKEDKSKGLTRKIDETRKKHIMFQQKPKKYHLNCLENDKNYLNAGIETSRKLAKPNPLVKNTYKKNNKSSEATATITKSQYLEKMNRQINKSTKEIRGGDKIDFTNKISSVENILPLNNAEPYYDMNKHRENLMKFLENYHGRADLIDNTKDDRMEISTSIGENLKRIRKGKLYGHDRGERVNPNVSNETNPTRHYKKMTVETTVSRFPENEPQNDNIRKYHCFDPIVPNEIDEISQRQDLTSDGQFVKVPLQNEPKNDNIRNNLSLDPIVPKEIEEISQYHDLTLNTFVNQFVMAPVQTESQNDNNRNYPRLPIAHNEVDTSSHQYYDLTLDTFPCQFAKTPGPVQTKSQDDNIRNYPHLTIALNEVDAIANMCQDLTVDKFACLFEDTSVQTKPQNDNFRNNPRFHTSNPNNFTCHDVAGASNTEIAHDEYMTDVPVGVESSLQSIHKSNENECRTSAEDNDLVDPLFNGVTKDDLRSVLDSWDLGHVYNLVKEYDLDLEEFISLSDDHLKEMFESSKESFATRVKLRNKIDSYKNLQSNFEKKTDTSGSNCSNVNVAAIFYGNPRIADIKKYFTTHNRLSEKYEKEMMDIILYYVFENQQLLNPKQILSITEQICEIFPSENLYFIPATAGTPASGKFYHRYHNKLKIFRNQNKIPKSTRYINKILKESKTNETDESHLKYGVDWEELNNINAFSLITDNFKRVHGDEISECLQKTWSIIFNRSSIRKIIAAVKDTNTKDMLNELPLSNDISRNAIIALSLHAILIPTNRSTNKKLWRATIATSQDCFMCRVKIESEIEDVLADRRKDCHDRNVELHPIIFAFGETISEITHIQYNFDEFTKAVDFCMKMYFTLGIPFPPECDQFYVALNQIFFKIDTGAKISTKLAMFLDDLLKL